MKNLHKDGKLLQNKLPRILKETNELSSSLPYFYRNVNLPDGKSLFENNFFIVLFTYFNYH